LPPGVSTHLLRTGGAEDFVVVFGVGQFDQPATGKGLLAYVDVAAEFRGASVALETTTEGTINVCRFPAQVTRRGAREFYE
jgi:hypothetical protein